MSVDNKQTDEKLLLRILLIGKSEVGKTSFMLQYTDNVFLNNHVKTIAVDCRSKSSLTQGKYAKICIFDPPGLEEFSTLTPAYWHFVEAIVFVAAFGDYDSLTYIKSQDSSIFEEATSKALRIVLLNKSDLKEFIGQEANDFEEEVRTWAASRLAYFCICSAKENKNVIEPIEKIISDLVQQKYTENDGKYKNQKTRRCKCEIF